MRTMCTHGADVPRSRPVGHPDVIARAAPLVGGDGLRGSAPHEKPQSHVDGSWPLAGDHLGQVVQQGLPPLGEAQLERGQRETVPGSMLLGDAVPAEMLHGDPGLGADGLEPHVKFGALVGGEGPFPPTHGQVVRRVPRTMPRS